METAEATLTPNPPAQKGKGTLIDWSDITGDKRALIEQRIRKFTPMVRGAVIRTMQRFPTLDRAEVESAAFYALARCARKFDVSLGFKFSTMAMKSVYRDCRKSAKNQGIRRFGSHAIPTRSLRAAMLSQPVKQTASPIQEIIHGESDIAAKVWLRGMLAQFEERDLLILNERFINERSRREIKELLEAAGLGSISTQRIAQIEREGMQTLVTGWKVFRYREEHDGKGIRTKADEGVEESVRG